MDPLVRLKLSHPITWFTSCTRTEPTSDCSDTCTPLQFEICTNSKITSNCIATRVMRVRFYVCMYKARGI